MHHLKRPPISHPRARLHLVGWAPLMLAAAAAPLTGCTSCTGGGGDSPGNTTELPTQAAVEPTPTSSVEATPSPTPELERPYAEMPLQVADVIFTGESKYDYSGLALGRIGDVNGDGLADMAVAAPGSDALYTDAGKVFIVFGQSAGWAWHSELSTSQATLNGDSRGERAGTTVAGGGDFNGDGFDDFVVGAPGQTAGGIGAGRVYGVFGKDDGWYPGQRLGTVDFFFDGVEGESLGEVGTVSAGGDLNGDGYADLVMGAYKAGRNGDERGIVYVVYGGADVWPRPGSPVGLGPRFLGDDEGDWLGFSVDLTRDLNGDGYDDLLVGAPGTDPQDGYNRGTLYLFLGSPAWDNVEFSPRSAQGVLIGTVEGEQFGSHVAAVGDIDGDGTEDVGAGAWGNAVGEDYSLARGKYYLLPSDVDLWDGAAAEDVGVFWIGENIGDYVGRPMLPAGDVDADGHSDVVMGSYLRDYPDTDAGNAHLLFGWGRERVIPFGATLQEVDVRFVGEDELYFTGFSVAGPGDVNGDGRDDLLIGALGAPGAGGAPQGGRVYLVYGRRYYNE